MASRDEPIAWLPNDHYYMAKREDLDVHVSERVKQALGVLCFAVVLTAVLLLSGGPS